ncbi:uncharacterized protein I206_100974 [Kwoniella pini CBS 10737]|uniref:Uncharacterized protein n=1 Tax=Kwoniella pini CBS 10737 TaxID=1296096 RepID=A0A1B9ICD9_9TREE|nr:uncharacterized protein I206_00352 [Kwoniella pini CBS 10737]OCF53051.1 hypothetical protein I206_00352 [Kwoniella pini CBS 10737]
MSEQEQQLQKQQANQSQDQKQEDEQYDNEEKTPFENTMSNGMIKSGQPGDDEDSKNAIKDVALNPLGKRKKMLSEQIGEENLKQVGKKDGKEDNDSGSLKIRIQLDLDVEVHLSARIKGDITIGLL